MSFSDVVDWAEYEAVDLAESFGEGQNVYDTIEGVKNAGKNVKEGAEKVLTWAPWLIGGGLLIGAAVVLGPYLLPLVSGWREALRK